MSEKKQERPSEREAAPGLMTRTTLDVLQALAWGEKHFGSLTTGRTIRLRDMRRCIESGLAESVGPVVLCDGDGYTIEPERYRAGYRMTEAGRAVLAAAEARHG